MASATSEKTESKRAAAQRRRLHRTAIHEAGHAVASIETRIPFKSVTIREGDGYFGRVESSFKIQRNRSEAEQSSALCMVRMAGPAAEKRHSGRWNWTGAGSDSEFVLMIAQCVFGLDFMQAHEFRTSVIKAADRFLAKQNIWKKVEAVAEALIEHGTLSSTRVRAICREVAA